MPLLEEGSEEDIPMELELPPPIPSKPRGKQKAQEPAKKEDNPEQATKIAEATQPPSPLGDVAPAPAHQLPPNPPSASPQAPPTMSATRRWAVVIGISILVPIIGLTIYTSSTPAISPTSPTTSSSSTPNEHQEAPPAGIAAAPQIPVLLAAPLAEASPRTYRV